MGEDMDLFAISATLEARPGKEGEVEEFLKSAQSLVMEEAGTTTWFAFRIGQATFGIFDTFANEAGLQAHLNGAIAKSLFDKAEAGRDLCGQAALGRLDGHHSASDRAPSSRSSE
jgi:quinol monooxygenase YgiN